MKKRTIDGAVVPITLAGLPRVSINNRSKLPSSSAVYFIVSSRTVYYIGAATNLKTRWRVNHHILKQLPAEELFICWLHSQKQELYKLEHAAIRLYKPVLNRKLGRFVRERTYLKTANGSIPLQSTSSYLNIK